MPVAGIIGIKDRQIYFKNEILKINTVLDKNLTKIEKIKKQEYNFIESQKVNQLDGKKKIVSLQLEIKSITEEIEIIELDYKNQKIRIGCYCNQSD